MPEGQGGIWKMLVDGGLGYLWFVLLAVWGGTVSYISRIRRGNFTFSFVELVGEWTISAFAGVMTALICQEMEFSLLLTSAFAGMSGHMGGRAVYMLEGFLCIRFGIPTVTGRFGDDTKDKD